MFLEFKTMDDLPIFQNAHQPAPAEVEAVTDLLINQVASYEAPLREDLVEQREGHERFVNNARIHLQDMVGVFLWLGAVSDTACFGRSSASTVLAELSALATTWFGAEALKPTNPAEAVRILVNAQYNNVGTTMPRNLSTLERRSQVAQAVRALKVLGFDTDAMLRNNETLFKGVKATAGWIPLRP